MDLEWSKLWLQYNNLITWTFSYVSESNFRITVHREIVSLLTVCIDNEVDPEGLQQDQNSQQNDYQQNIIQFTQGRFTHGPENGSCHGMSRQNDLND
jgi:hypothetical protein